MRCENCKRLVFGRVEFCSKCGAKITRAKKQRPVERGAFLRGILVGSGIIIFCILAFLGIGFFSGIKPNKTTSSSPIPTPMLTQNPTQISMPSPSPTPENSMLEKVAARGILALKKVLKNPDSLQVHEITGQSNLDETWAYMDISAQNGFGGMNREIYHVSTSNEAEALGWTDNTYQVTLYKTDATYGMIGDEVSIDLVMSLVNKNDINEMLQSTMPSITYVTSTASTSPEYSLSPTKDIQNNLDIPTEHIKIAKYSQYIDASTFYSAGLKSDGSVVLTGFMKELKLNAVLKWTDIVAVSAGSCHTVGLKPNGTVVAVGDNSYGQCKVNSWRNVVAISAGNNFTLGLRKDGTVALAGLIDDSGVFPGKYNTSSWSDITSISAGTWHAVGLRSDGTVVAVGENDYGQCDVEEWENIIAVSAGYAYTAGLKSDGTVVVAGEIGFGKVTVNFIQQDQPYYSVADWTNIIAISAGDEYLVGLRSDGTVVAVGRDDKGQYDGVEGWKNIVAISAGDHHTLALTKGGIVLSVGSNDNGECNVSSWKLFSQPVN